MIFLVFTVEEWRVRSTTCVAVSGQSDLSICWATIITIRISSNHPSTNTSQTR